MTAHVMTPDACRARCMRPAPSALCALQSQITRIVLGPGKTFAGQNVNRVRFYVYYACAAVLVICFAYKLNLMLRITHLSPSSMIMRSVAMLAMWIKESRCARTMSYKETISWHNTEHQRHGPDMPSAACSCCAFPPTCSPSTARGESLA